MTPGTPARLAVQPHRLGTFGLSRTLDAGKTSLGESLLYGARVTAPGR